MQSVESDRRPGGEGSKPRRRLLGGCDEHESVCVRVGKRPPQYTVGHREDGDIEADAEGECGHCGECERRIATHEAERVTNILQDGAGGMPETGGGRGWIGGRHVASLGAGMFSGRMQFSICGR